MPEMHLKQRGFTYSACGSDFKNLKKTGDLRYIYKNELGKACFQHDMAYADFKNLTKRTVSDKDLRDKVFKVFC